MEDEICYQWPTHMDENLSRGRIYRCSGYLDGVAYDHISYLSYYDAFNDAIQAHEEAMVLKRFSDEAQAEGRFVFSAILPIRPIEEIHLMIGNYQKEQENDRMRKVREEWYWLYDTNNRDGMFYSICVKWLSEFESPLETYLYWLKK